MDRNSKTILAICAVWAIGMSLLIVKMDKAKPVVVPSLECSVDDTLSFVAFNVTEWDMRNGTLVVTSRDDGEPYVMARTMVAGETCREIYP